MKATKWALQHFASKCSLYITNQPTVNIKEIIASIRTNIHSHMYMHTCIHAYILYVAIILVLLLPNTICLLIRRLWMHAFINYIHAGVHASFQIISAQTK